MTLAGDIPNYDTLPFCNSFFAALLVEDLSCFTRLIVDMPIDALYLRSDTI